MQFAEGRPRATLAASDKVRYLIVASVCSCMRISQPLPDLRSMHIGVQHVLRWKLRNSSYRAKCRGTRRVKSGPGTDCRPEKNSKKKPSYQFWKLGSDCGRLLLPLQPIFRMISI